MKALEVLNAIATVWEGWPDSTLYCVECSHNTMEDLHRACVANDTAHIISAAKQLVGVEASH